MDGCPRTRCYNQAAVWCVCKGTHATLYFGSLAYIDRPNVNADWITANCPIPTDMAGSRSTAARVTLGAISLNNSSHFPLRLYSNCMKPVTLPPGCARLSTNPAPTGSGAIANTIGMSRFVCKAAKLVTPDAK